MDFKKCKRCGCFFINGNDVCCSCEQKDNNEISRLKNYFIDNDNVSSSLYDISASTGIAMRDLTRHIEIKDFKDIISKNNCSL